MLGSSIFSLHCARVSVICVRLFKIFPVDILYCQDLYKSSQPVYRREKVLKCFIQKGPFCNVWYLLETINPRMIGNSQSFVFCVMFSCLLLRNK
jgi:hypothetical protein